jgi:hypothetical protein
MRLQYNNHFKEMKSMKASSWTVFFMFKPLTTIYTTILTEEDDVDDEVLISLAKQKIINESGIDIDDLAEVMGRNDNFGEDWVNVEQNDIEATEEELAVLKIYKTR